MNYITDMRTNRLFSSLLVLWIAVLGLPQQVLGADCANKVTLTLKDSQGGIAGATGTVWTISPDCSFTVSRFVNAAVAEPHRRGQLTAQQQTALSQLLAEKAASALPPKIGEVAPVNPHQITLEYGGQTSVLHFAPGATDIERIKAAEPGSPARRLLEILASVKDMTGSAE